MGIESFSQLPLQTVIPSYLYQQYADDEDLQAFVAAYNDLAQSYLDWYNQTPLSVYTDDSISGLLLDWVGTGLYGLERPVISTSSSTTIGPYWSAPYASRVPYGMLSITDSGMAAVASDDVYKRTLTWNLYAGDGYQASIPWLRSRVTRFLYGANGTDITVDDLLNVSIDYDTTPAAFGYAGMMPYMQQFPYMTTQVFVAASKLVITVPNIPMASTFKALFDSGILQAPFQVNYTVTIA